jgi:hypothetical protein
MATVYITAEFLLPNGEEDYIEDIEVEVDASVSIAPASLRGHPDTWHPDESEIADVTYTLEGGQVLTEEQFTALGGDTHKAEQILWEEEEARQSEAREYRRSGYHPSLED